MRPSDMAETLQSILPTRRPVFLEGPPGIGKSTLIRDAADHIFGDPSSPWDYSNGTDPEYLCDIRLYAHDPSDFKFPIPDVENQTINWVQTILPSDPDWKGLIVLEELPQSAPLLQSIALQITLDRRVGGQPIPQGALVVAAGNRPQDRTGANRLISALSSRFIFLDLEVSNDDWHEWALAKGISAEVRSFLRFKAALLFQFDPSTGHRSFPSPRSWEYVSDILPHLNDTNMHAVISGCVGEGPAAEFIGFTQIYRQLPDPDTVLADPMGSTVPTEPAVLYALCGSLADRLKDKNELADVYAKYCRRLPNEFSVLAIKDGQAVCPRLVTSTEGAAWVKDHRELLLAS